MVRITPERGGSHAVGAPRYGAPVLEARGLPQVGEEPSDCERREPGELPQLPQVGGGRAERVDAARNRAAILAAAERLLAERGAEAITMDSLAGEAGVGKGTLFRRFGDRAGLFHALLDESERRLQEAFIRGPSPLGPGAPPAERLVAFGCALLELTVERADLLVASEPAVRALRYRGPVYSAYRAHVRALLVQAGVSAPEYLSDALLAALAPDLVVHQLQRGLSLEECKRGWGELIGGVLGRCG